MIDDWMNSTFFDKKILITGGAGFIGSHLAEKLAKFTNNLTCIDNYLSGCVSNHVEGASYVDGDIKTIVDIFGKQNFDFQITEFKGNAQPYYVLLDTDEQPLVKPLSYDASVSNFVVFLEAAMSEFQRRNQ